MEQFNCLCIKCKTSFVSEDGADFDGEAFCPTCKEKNKEIAKKVDAQIAARKEKKVKPEFINPFLEIRNDPKKRNKRIINYMNIPR